MKCPVCNVNLVMSDRQGVEIDYCPECRGVWLDRGELDKIIERSTQESPVRRSEGFGEAPRASYSERSHDDHSDSDKHGYYDERSSLKKKKRGGLLGDLFDFGD